jgi:aldehyde dehydrogenase (NAD+)
MEEPLNQLKNSETFKIVPNDKDLERSGEIIEKMRDFFNTGETLTYEFRKTQLKKFYQAIKNNEKGVYEAVRKDMGKPDYEIMTSELGLMYYEITHAIKNLKKWMKKKKAKTPFYNFGTKSYRYATPKGVTLIIGPWNYPFMLAFNPLVGAIASGCCAVIKPPDFAFETSKTIDKIVNEAFDEKYIKVIEGDASAAQKLLEFKWDHIFFTGSTRVGKIVQEAANKHMTTVTLELGGPNPTIIDKTANIGKTIDSIMYGKWINLGQTCLAPNHLFVHESIKDKFLSEFIRKMKKTFSDNPAESPYLARINNPNHHKRLVGLLDEGEILHGGKSSERDLFIEPTILINADFSKSRVTKEEIFGPILPVIPYNDTNFTLDDVIKKTNENIEPLSIYLFSKDKNVHKKVLNELRAQNIVINDTALQFANPNIPFGGIGSSGNGGAHGYFTFEQFSIIKSIMEQNMPLHTIRWVRRPPYNKIKLFLTRFFFK